MQSKRNEPLLSSCCSYSKRQDCAEDRIKSVRACCQRGCMRRNANLAGGILILIGVVMDNKPDCRPDGQQQAQTCQAFVEGPHAIHPKNAYAESTSKCGKNAIDLRVTLRFSPPYLH